jgi:phosphoglycerate dehydrogenase-like enzyme
VKARPRVVVVTGSASESVLPAFAAINDRADLVVTESARGIKTQLQQDDIVLVLDFRFDQIDSLLLALPNLKWIHVAGVGVDGILTPNLRASDIIVTNSRGVFDVSIAEYVLTLILAHLKDYRATIDFQREKVWRHRTTDQLAGQRVIVIGTGSIGMRIGATLKALQADVSLVGRVRDQDSFFGQILSSEELEVAVHGVRFLVIAAPLTAETRGLVDRRILQAMGRSGYVVNVARGPLIVETDLIEALEGNLLAGAALDVFDEEPLDQGSRLWSMPNVLVSPHMSGDYRGVEGDLIEVFVANLDKWLSEEPLDNLVDKRRGYVSNLRNTRGA